MNEERLHQLICGELDGKNSTAESLELARTLESKPDTADLLKDFHALEEMFAAVELVDPPPQLQHRLRGLIPAAANSVTAPRTGKQSARSLPLLTRFRFGYAMAFCLGLVLGFGVFRAVERLEEPAGIGADDLFSGSIATEVADSTREGEQVVTLDLGGEGPSLIRAYRLQSSIGLDLRLAADRELEIIILHSEHHSLTDYQWNGARLHEVVDAPHQTLLRLGGAGFCRLVFGIPVGFPAALQLEVRARDEVLYKGSFSPGQGRN